MDELEDDDLFAPDFGCGRFDFECQASEAIAKMLVSFMRELGNLIAEMLTGAFSGAVVSSEGWVVAQGQFWVWFVIAAVLAIAIGMTQLIPAVLMQHGVRVVGIAVSMIAGPFLCVLALRYAPRVVNWSHITTNDVLRGLTGEDVAIAILRVMGFGDPRAAFDPLDGGVVKLLLFGPSGDAALTVGKLLLAVLILGIVALAAVVLYLSMSMRAFALVVLIAFAPAALMFVGQPVMKDLVKRWAQIGLGLLLAEPLAAGVIVLAVKMAALGSPDSIGLLLVTSAAIVLAAMSPFWAMSLVSFAGEGVGDAMERRMDSTGRAGRAAGSGVRWAGRRIGVAR